MSFKNRRFWQYLFLEGVMLLLPIVIGVDQVEAAAPQVTVATDRSDALYAVGDTVTFIVKVVQDGKPVSGVSVQWQLSEDGANLINNGTATLENGETRITGSLNRPGFLQCKTTYQGKVTLTGAGIDPLSIKPSLPVPDDFDEFWNNKKAQLAEIPMNPRLTPVNSGSADLVALDVQLDALGAPVSGYLARPANAKPGSLPAIITLQGAGVQTASIPRTWASEGMLAFNINAHGIPNGKNASYYSGLADGELKDYRLLGRLSRDTYYFLGMHLRIIRAIDFITSLPEWDGRTLILYGTSQGGAQALAGAGLDTRVTFFVAGVPSMADLTAVSAGRIMSKTGASLIDVVGFDNMRTVLTTVRYFDSMNFATRIKASGVFTVGFIDTQCPPTTVYAAYNNVKSQKSIYNDVVTGHANSPAATEFMKVAVLAHVKEMKQQ